jgi:hypothetical protein
VPIQTVTGQQIIDLARLYADERPAGANAFISTTDDLLLVNTAIQSMHDLLLSLGGEDYFAVDASLVTVPSTATVTLPATFYRLISLHVNWGTNRNEEIHELPGEGDRYLLTDFNGWGEGTRKAFRIVANTLELYPTPTTAQTLIMRYVPVATELASLADTTPSINGWHKLCALQIAAEMRMVRGQPNGMLQQAYARELERIETIAAERTQNEPARVRDVYPESGLNTWRWPWPAP